LGEKWKMLTNQSAILLITYNFKMFMLFENLIKLSSFIDDGNSKLVRQKASILYINSVRLFVCDEALVRHIRPGPLVEISCSQSFLSKDLWFPSRNFLFPEFSFKRSVVSELGV